MIRTVWREGDEDLADAYSIRRKVFIQEQGVPEAEEIDGTDGAATHLIVYDGKEPVAAGRLIVKEGAMYLGRVAVLKERRGEGLGDFTVRLLIRRAFDRGYNEQLVHSQITAVGFYEKLGFIKEGEVFLDAGIQHIEMRRSGDIKGNC